MPNPAEYTAIVSIGFLVITTAVLIWFAYLGERSDAHKPETVREESEGEAGTTD